MFQYNNAMVNATQCFENACAELQVLKEDLANFNTLRAMGKDSARKVPMIIFATTNLAVFATLAMTTPRSREKSARGGITTFVLKMITFLKCKQTA
jgi:hypothetical protein